MFFWVCVLKNFSPSEMRADARPNASTHAYCMTTRLPKSATFELSKSGERLAAQLAELWVHRVGFLGGLWNPTSSAAECFSPSASAAHQVPAEVADLEAQLTKAQARRLCGIIGVVPKS